MPRPSDLPEFGRPPVTEVLLSIQFGTTGLKTFHSAKLIAEFPELPDVSEQAPLAPTFEVFGGQQTMVLPPISFGFPVVTPRYWLKSNDGKQLLQIQPDRVIRNWLRTSSQDEYPRYESIRESVGQDLTKIDAFLKRNGLGSIKPNQVEVTYINSIDLPDKSNPHCALSRIFRIWSNEYQDDQGRIEEDATINFRYVLQGASGGPAGRLYVSIQPATRSSDGANIVSLNLTVRGKPESDSIVSALAFCDYGREVIVRAFTSMTRPEMHKYWERK